MEAVGDTIADVETVADGVGVTTAAPVGETVGDDGDTEEVGVTARVGVPDGETRLGVPDGVTA